MRKVSTCFIQRPFLTIGFILFGAIYLTRWPSNCRAVYNDCDSVKAKVGSKFDVHLKRDNCTAVFWRQKSNRGVYLKNNCSAAFPWQEPAGIYFLWLRNDTKINQTLDRTFRVSVGKDNCSVLPPAPVNCPVDLTGPPMLHVREKVLLLGLLVVVIDWMVCQSGALQKGWLWATSMGAGAVGFFLIWWGLMMVFTASAPSQFVLIGLYVIHVCDTAFFIQDFKYMGTEDSNSQGSSAKPKAGAATDQNKDESPKPDQKKEELPKTAVKINDDDPKTVAKSNTPLEKKLKQHKKAMTKVALDLLTFCEAFGCFYVLLTLWRPEKGSISAAETDANRTIFYYLLLILTFLVTQGGLLRGWSFRRLRLGVFHSVEVYLYSVRYFAYLLFLFSHEEYFFPPSERYVFFLIRAEYGLMLGWILITSAASMRSAMQAIWALQKSVFEKELKTVERA